MTQVKNVADHRNSDGLIKQEKQMMLTVVGVDNSDKCNKTTDEEGTTTASNMDTEKAALF
jgi:hypothetical protein